MTESGADEEVGMLGHVLWSNARRWLIKNDDDVVVAYCRRVDKNAAIGVGDTIRMHESSRHRVRLIVMIYNFWRNGRAVAVVELTGAIVKKTVVVVPQ
mmetsp:Transcript_22352/g.48480  ORF Transcript_22352/g.48480 Transcript_22352/m.48480 type:complete len:98 (+) Transcript_22352:56-349(+)